jgi:hypothetical protein
MVHPNPMTGSRADGDGDAGGKVSPLTPRSGEGGGYLPGNFI